MQSQRLSRAEYNQRRRGYRGAVYQARWASRGYLDALRQARERYLEGIDSRLASVIEGSRRAPYNRIDARIEGLQHEVRELLRYLNAYPIRRAGFDLRLTASYAYEETPRIIRLRDLKVLFREVYKLAYGPQRGVTIRTLTTGDLKRDVDDLIASMKGPRVARLGEAA